MTNKSKLTVYIAPETKDIVSECCDMDNCSSMSELVEKAILFYNGYLHAKRAEYYLPRILGSILRGTLGMFGDRIGKLLFKQAVECNVANHILAADTDMDVETYERLRNRSLREVQRTKGEISFEDDLIFQKSL